MYQVQFLKTKTEMLEQLPILQQLYSDSFTVEKYNALLDDMLGNNYQQIIIKNQNKVLGLSGLWVGTKLWCGKYVEIDNFIVSKEYRNLKIGTLLVDEIFKFANEINANQICLDAYVDNFVAQKFYINQGFTPRGFHYIKNL
jgi:ribosomal protein S18 acetylase RimI-like enzyme